MSLVLVLTRISVYSLTVLIRSVTSWKELKTRSIEPDVIIDLKDFSSDVPIMKALGLLFVDLCVQVRVVP